MRTQKGLVGKCTLEKGKTRIPISHPAFEEFRALAFINNLQWREADTGKALEQIPISLKKQILRLRRPTTMNSNNRLLSPCYCRR